MRYQSLEAFLTDGRRALAKGPVALVFAEDLVEVDSTIRHHLNTGFAELVLFAPIELRLSRLLEEQVHRVDLHVTTTALLVDTVNRVIAAAPNVWLYYCYNAEYLFFPFCETRSVAEMLAFHAEERREAMLTYVIDLYAGDLERHPNAVSLTDACLDRTGYYALSRHGENGPKERQLDFYGGLRWRFEEHVPKDRRKIDRISLFRAKKGLHLRTDHTFDEEEYNTYACPWHNNLTAAICSFRTAKALKTNAGSSFDIRTFRWHNSVPFEWSSTQLMNLGLMEPGQWF
ncbi:hypothetical protein SAMN05216257_10370 [Meinhardsimonia xiamenensis]|jgi:hypothetical protein|uniref:Uncharacterized protein n=1 Tax=Meinhardsimonia xiamenensis TaxID=990712 RepID=A0A1G9CDF6_9RHOB|nr:hypothetical protein [Meinhardsimonia xiamenensis]PRX38400.1 hypothetical protein LV81_00684 [Meinhardsimonia xiamenensis]SDK49690.1 hypothetical protein SAMN05216257_10370 [Meinhardsimonia xiamenensis]